VDIPRWLRFLRKFLIGTSCRGYEAKIRPMEEK
jgi:hypothetical protein